MRDARACCAQEWTVAQPESAAARGQPGMQAVIPPGSTIGILGGGQLGRMIALAAAQLGYRCHIYAPEADSVAADVSAGFTCAEWDDSEALARFAAGCAVVTYEFENVPVGPVAMVTGAVPLRPGIRALEVAQSRIDEKVFAQDCGGRPAPFAFVNVREELESAIEAVGLPAILKTNRMGYDGKGQVRLSGGEDPDACWAGIAEQPAVLEGFVDFFAEFSVILCRAIDGDIHFWDTPQNTHEGGILARSSVPAPAEVRAQEAEARRLAARIADALDYVGVMTLEFFATQDGPVFNEMAPRVHNSGHWTIEGALTSQFENHVRAICGLPLGDTALTAARVEMSNLIGAEADGWAGILADPANHLHLYGKAEARPGRKMGHVTRLTLA